MTQGTLMGPGLWTRCPLAKVTGLHSWPQTSRSTRPRNSVEIVVVGTENLNEDSQMMERQTWKVKLEAPEPLDTLYSPLFTSQLGFAAVLTGMKI